jgi:transglutaminase/protease-like cytokinesis protein 3
MRIGFVLYLLFAVQTLVYAQDRDYSTVDATAIFYPSNFKTTQGLVQQLKKDFTEPQDQLRAAYTWVIHNIAYEPDEYLTYQFQYRILDERNAKLASTREDIISRTMNGKKAVCEGYALTLERILEELGINSYVVRGDVKRDVTDIGRPFKKNHMWLIAIVNQKPVIMDPTWGAGRFIETFRKEPSYAYYDVAPSHFLKTHYPEVFDDAYVNETVSKEEFSNWPLILSSEIELKDLDNQSGILKYKNLKKGMNFSMVMKSQDKLLYTLDDGVMRELETTQEATKTSFFIRNTARTKRLVIYDGSKPILAYLVK